MSITEYLVSKKGANKGKKRRGRGSGSGHGRTACRGHKGQKARGMTKKDKGFEGGQMPLMRRLPKRGFTNIFKLEYQIINTANLNKLKDGTSVDAALLKDKGFIKDAKSLVKVLGTGKLEKKLEVKVHAFSKSAKDAIEKAGGKAILIEDEKDKG